MSVVLDAVLVVDAMLVIGVVQAVAAVSAVKVVLLRVDCRRQGGGPDVSLFSHGCTIKAY